MVICIFHGSNSIRSRDCGINIISSYYVQIVPPIARMRTSLVLFTYWNSKTAWYVTLHTCNIVSAFCLQSWSSHSVWSCWGNSKKNCWFSQHFHEIRLETSFGKCFVSWCENGKSFLLCIHFMSLSGRWEDRYESVSLNERIRNGMNAYMYIVYLHLPYVTTGTLNSITRIT